MEATVRAIAKAMRRAVANAMAVQWQWKKQWEWQQNDKRKGNCSVFTKAMIMAKAMEEAMLMAVE